MTYVQPNPGLCLICGHARWRVFGREVVLCTAVVFGEGQEEEGGSAYNSIRHKAKPS